MGQPILLMLLFVCSLSWGILSPEWFNTTALAGPLSDRLAQFPEWKSQPPLKPAQGNLHYPDWFRGEWQVTSTLTALEAPLAPDFVTPGFADQQQSLDQLVVFTVRFISEIPALSTNPAFVPKAAAIPEGEVTIADQVYNSRSLIKAYLGDGAVESVEVDPQDPTHQVTRLKGDRKLTSVISARATETNVNDFITSELFQQIFSSPNQIYINQVENTTDYHLVSGSQIDADQVTAIYLSPKDPQYFKAGNQPVALYRYHLTLAALDKALGSKV